MSITRSTLYPKVRKRHDPSICGQTSYLVGRLGFGQIVAGVSEVDGQLHHVVSENKTKTTYWDFNNHFWFTESVNWNLLSCSSESLQRWT